jgi:3-mercaptopyruvate sulfurtransferase SseA
MSEVNGMPTSLMEMVEEARKSVVEVPAGQIAKDLDSGKRAFVVDVREPSEFAKGHIPGAVNIPRGMLEIKADAASSLADPDLVGRREAAVIVYCLRPPAPGRSWLAKRCSGWATPASRLLREGS